jgi:hypothetical protein
MSVLAFAYLPGPKDFHEIARLRLIKIPEVLSKPKLVEEASCARPIRVPAAPDTFPIALISNDQMLQSSVVEVKLASRA